jgi:ribosomal protein L34
MEYQLLRKNGYLDKRRSDFGEAVICSRRKKGNGKTYIVSDRLAGIAEGLIRKYIRPCLHVAMEGDTHG